MPKDEFDFEDPMELNGVALFTDEDTTDAMCECFIEEFMMLGYDAARILALFRHPHYIGMNMVLQNRGEQFVREKIESIFDQWGRTVNWPATSRATHKAPSRSDAAVASPISVSTPIDPMGSPAPTYQI
jgi:hypothetical protein